MERLAIYFIRFLHRSNLNLDRDFGNMDNDHLELMSQYDESRREDFKVQQNKSLCIRIESCELLQSGRYYITVQMEDSQHKKRTELSDELSNPIFITNTFSFPLSTGKVEKWQKARFELYERTKEKYSKKDSTKCVGECTIINITSLMGMRQSLSFVRFHQGKEFQVGRFNISLSIENDYSKKSGLEGSYFNGGIDDPIEATSMTHQMPVEQEGFTWRVRIDLR